MNYDSRIYFPMSINATALFDKIRDQSQIWSRELDNRNNSRSLLRNIPGLPSAPPPGPGHIKIGRHVNIQA